MRNSKVSRRDIVPIEFCHTDRLSLIEELRGKVAPQAIGMCVADAYGEGLTGPVEISFGPDSRIAHSE